MKDLRKLVLLTTAVFLLTTPVFTQIPTIDQSPHELVCDKLYPTTVILKKGDTLTGFVKWVNRQANQRRIYFYKDTDLKTKGIHYQGVSVRSYVIEGELYENVNPGKDKSFFDDADVLALKLLDGGISIYQFYRDTMGLKFKYKNDTNYLDMCRTDKEFAKTLCAYKNGVLAANLSDGFKFGLKYKENMSELVSDDEELAKKIMKKEKGYRMIHRDKIILEYNDWYKNRE